MFEAGVLAGQLYSRVDILTPTGQEGWDIVEVKSSTSVKDAHINDVAFQRYCCNQSGLNVRKCYLALINNQYVKDGEIDPEGLFNIHDVTDQVEEASVGIQLQPVLAYLDLGRFLLRQYLFLNIGTPALPFRNKHLALCLQIAFQKTQEYKA